MLKLACLVLGSAPFILGIASDAVGGEASPFTGFYAGGHVSYAYGAPGVMISGSEDGQAEIEKVFDITPDQRNNAGDPCTLASCRYARDGVFGGRIGSEPEGFTGGLHAGYNYQMRNVVLGIEGSYDFGEVDGSGKGEISPKSGSLYTGQTLDTSPAYLTAKSSLENIASLRGRLGFTSGAFMLYGTGGVAWADFEGSVTSPDGFAHPANPAVPNASGTVKFSDSMVGWVAGGGFEYMFSNAISIRVEALHYDFGSVGFSVEDENNIEQMVGKQDVTVNQARVGVTYHIN
jgi:opacity protein-like surface antigen